MDNAPIHAAVGLDLEQFVTSRGGILVFLPPYCPEFSHIEKMFAQVKRYLRRQQFDLVTHDIVKLGDAMKTITVKQAIQYFADCGYTLGAAAHQEALERGLIDQ